jgi:hypothetical protein
MEIWTGSLEIDGSYPLKISENMRIEQPSPHFKIPP